MLTKNSFSKTRAGILGEGSSRSFAPLFLMIYLRYLILGLTSLVDLVVAILFLVIVVSDWVSFDTLQSECASNCQVFELTFTLETITLALFFINVLSALILTFMWVLDRILQSRIPS